MASCGDSAKLMVDYGIERGVLGEPLRRDCTLVTVANSLLDMGTSVALDTICAPRDRRLDDVAAISKTLKTRIVLADFRSVVPGPGESIRPYYEAAASDGPRTKLFLVRGAKDHGGHSRRRRPCLGLPFSRRRPQVFASKC